MVRQREKKGDSAKRFLDQPEKETGGRTCLHLAAAGGHCDVLRVVLGAGAAPAPQDTEGRTPLMVAAAAQQPQTAAEIAVAIASATSIREKIRLKKLGEQSWDDFKKDHLGLGNGEERQMAA